MIGLTREKSSSIEKDKDEVIDRTNRLAIYKNIRATIVPNFNEDTYLCRGKALLKYNFFHLLNICHNADSCRLLKKTMTILICL